jgi:hypothetical protein
MPSSKEVAQVEAGNVPALAPTPATTITFEDITIPTLYVGQRTSKAVEKGIAKFGDIFIAEGAGDDEARVLWEIDSKDEGVLFHPLHMYKSWTWTDGNNLRSWPYGTTGEPPAEAVQLAEESGKAVFRTYNYLTFVPGYDEEMPVNLRLNSKSQRPAANKINMTVSRSGKPYHTHAFRITSRLDSNGNTKWATPIVAEVKADPKQVEQAHQLFGLILPGLTQRANQRESQAPAI